MSQQIHLGQIVTSGQGRDAGKAYVVIKLGEMPFVFVADGRIRKVERPKKKNICHLVLHQDMAHELAEKLQSGQNASNLDIRRVLDHWSAQREIKA